ncbi:ammonium transporter [Klebsiella pneumoniae]|uniref:Ammonium transporter n=1 Tax=Klebsiella pneumoniae TaxID=573 RepID=A0A2X3GLJ5_KLEPN|nr:ammonium transporter [Klebsiella pneumoniae]
MVFTGTAILYVGWFGFNAGSASAANEIAALAFVNTTSWRPLRLSWRGPLANGLCAANLHCWAPAPGQLPVWLALRPACGYIGVGGALIVGIASGLAGIWGGDCAETLAARVDDPCDVFGVHGVCGIVGCILTGIFAATSLARVGYAEGVTMGHQLLVQLESIAITVVWSGVVAFIGYKVAGYDRRLRVPEEQEREGLDVTAMAKTPITPDKKAILS